LTDLAGARATAAPLLISGDRLKNGMLWLTAFSGFCVFWEPAPYEFLSLLTLVLFLALGMRFPREVIPFMFLLLMWQLGACITLIPVAHLEKTVMWTLIGIFLAVTGLFFAIVVAEKPEERIRIIIAGYIAASLAAGFLAIIGYFQLPPFHDQLVLYGRAKGTFKDPNVFGPFLVLPAMILLQRIYMKGLRAGLLPPLALFFIIVAVFLSFSRAAWAHFAISGMLMTFFTLLIVPKPSDRARILLMAIAALLGLLLLIAALLSVPQVAELFSERASLEQSYDGGHMGRFNRHILGFQLALDKPIGIGMLQFHKYFIEDPHNTFLNGFMSYGWLGGLAYPTLVFTTLFVGFRTMLIPAPWRPTFVCVMSTISVLLCMSWIIDIDHWRHLHLLMGLTWGMAIASSRLRRKQQATLRPASAPA
jgi:hypothetical protein